MKTRDQLILENIELERELIKSKKGLHSSKSIERDTWIKFYCSFIVREDIHINDLGSTTDKAMLEFKRRYPN